MTSVLNRNKLQSPYSFHVGWRLEVKSYTPDCECDAVLYMHTCIAKPSCQHCVYITYFFICRAYAPTRGYLCDNLHEYSLKDLLYGTEHGTGHENKTLFLKIQDFLRK